MRSHASRLRERLRRLQSPLAGDRFGHDPGRFSEGEIDRVAGPRTGIFSYALTV
jgi:hypothetical protein